MAVCQSESRPTSRILIAGQHLSLYSRMRQQKKYYKLHETFFSVIISKQRKLVFAVQHLVCFVL